MMNSITKTIYIQFALTLYL